MNSEPRENAAWRGFGMLDRNESGAFDEALRTHGEWREAAQETDALLASVAVVVSRPVPPAADSLERIRGDLGLGKPRTVRRWVAWSGWAAAAVLALAFGVQYFAGEGSVRKHSESRVVDRELPRAVRPETGVLGDEGVGGGTIPQDAADLGGQRRSAAGTASANLRSDSRRLVQEIEVLREQLAVYRQRERERVVPVPGVAWPIVMRMRPPGVVAMDENEEGALSAILGEALMTRQPQVQMAERQASGEPPVESVDGSAETGVIAGGAPTAIPIYDAARDAGTLVVGNLPTLDPSENYNLWVMTRGSQRPVHVGKLPATSQIGAESLDFSLGSTGVVPAGFILTRDVEGQVVSPNVSNTVLQGP